MQIIISPAKLMDFDAKSDRINTTKSGFNKKTAKLIDICQELSVKEIADLMKINAKMAHDVYEYFQTFNFKDTPERVAALAYNGIAWKGLNFYDFVKSEVNFAKKHFNIISGLYGVLQPTDLVKPYRLEMGLKIVLENATDLYDFWHPEIENYFSKKLADDDNVLINLASKEYAKVVLTKKIKKQARIIHVKFIEQQGNELKQIVVYTKKARGMMARFILKNHITKPEDAKAFDYEGYLFNSKASKENSWVFTR